MKVQIYNYMSIM